MSDQRVAIFAMLLVVFFTAVSMCIVAHRVFSNAVAVREAITREVADSIYQYDEDEDEETSPPSPDVVHALTKFEYPEMCEVKCLHEPRINHEFVCASVFRDMADYVVAWPYQHFGDTAFTPPFSEIVDCLPPGAIIFSQTGPGVTQFCNEMLPRMTKPFVFLTGQSDYNPTEWCPSLLDHPLLIRWFAQNADQVHDKMRPLPFGLNCYEHAPEMKMFLTWKSKYNELGDFRAGKLGLVNFGVSTHGSRVTTRATLCRPDTVSYIHCHEKVVHNNVRDNQHLVELYKEFSEYPFWFAPRGNGVETHRAWEAMYSGSVPIIQKYAPLDSLYDDGDLPVILLDDITSVNKPFLEGELTKFYKTSYARRKLTPEYWINLIIKDTETATNVTVPERRACWALNP